MIIDTITGNYHIDQLINIYRNISKTPSEFIEVRYLSDDKWKIIPWSRRWWNNYEGSMKVCFADAETTFFKCKDDFWFKTKYIVRKFLAAGESDNE